MFLCKIAHFTMIILFKIYDPCVTFFLPKYRYFAAFKIIFVLLLPKKTTAVRSSDNITRLTRRFRTLKPHLIPSTPSEKSISWYSNQPKAFI